MPPGYPRQGDPRERAGWPDFRPWRLRWWLGVACWCVDRDKTVECPQIDRNKTVEKTVQPDRYKFLIEIFVGVPTTIVARDFPHARLRMRPRKCPPASAHTRVYTHIPARDAIRACACVHVCARVCACVCARIMRACMRVGINHLSTKDIFNCTNVSLTVSQYRERENLSD